MACLVAVRSDGTLETARPPFYNALEAAKVLVDAGLFAASHHGLFDRGSLDEAAWVRAVAERLERAMRPPGFPEAPGMIDGFVRCAKQAGFRPEQMLADHFRQFPNLRAAFLAVNSD